VSRQRRRGMPIRCPYGTWSPEPRVGAARESCAPSVHPGYFIDVTRGSVAAFPQLDGARGGVRTRTPLSGKGGSSSAEAVRPVRGRPAKRRQCGSAVHFLRREPERPTPSGESRDHSVITRARRQSNATHHHTPTPDLTPTFELSRCEYGRILRLPLQEVVVARHDHVDVVSSCERTEMVVILVACLGANLHRGVNEIDERRNGVDELCRVLQGDPLPEPRPSGQHFTYPASSNSDDQLERRRELRRPTGTVVRCVRRRGSRCRSRTPRVVRPVRRVRSWRGSRTARRD
jgi:hypothetical protein